MKKAIAASIFASFALGALAENYTWQGTGENASWSEESNWSPNGVPGAEDTVMFNGEASVNISSTVTISTATMNGNVTLITCSGADKYELRTTGGFSGSGKLILSNAIISNNHEDNGGGTHSGNAISIAVNVEAALGTENQIKGYANTVTVSGNITGTGKIAFYGTFPGGSIVLTGDNSGFYGTGAIYNDSNNNFRFGSSSSASEHALWDFGDWNQKKEIVSFKGGTLKWGRVNAARRLADAAYLRFFKPKQPILL